MTFYASAVHTFWKKAHWGIFSLILLALAIGLTPRVPVGTLEGLGRGIDIRGEDIWMLVLAIVWCIAFLQSKQKAVEKPPLFIPILFWTGVGFVSLLMNMALGDGSVMRGLLYFAKELQFFFVYVYVFFWIRNLASAKMLVRVWIGIGLANIAWVLYQIFSGTRTGEYGISALNEWGVFPTGAFFLLLFVFLFNWWIYVIWGRLASEIKEYLYLAAILSVIVGLLGVLSKTVLVGFLFAVTVSMALYVFKIRTWKTVFASALLFMGISVFTLGAYFFLILPTLDGAERLGETGSLSNITQDVRQDRFSVANAQLQEAVPRANERPWMYAIGQGKGAILFSHETHNQYLRNFIETGIVGSIAFLVLIGSVLLATGKGFHRSSDEFSLALSAGVITATLTMLFVSLVVDAFIVVKVNMLYWFFMGMAMAVLSYRRVNGNMKNI